MEPRSHIAMPLRAAAVLAALALAGCATISDLFGGSSGAASSEGAHAVAAQRSLEYLPDAETLDWIDPETGLPARVTVLSTAHDGSGRFCRRLAYQPDLAAEGVVSSYCRDAETGLWETAD
jgi:hypothetical protein